MRVVPSLSSTLTIGLLAVLVLAVLVPASPYLQKYPSADSGIFLYTGWRVTQGELPYRDVWDHKPPLIFVVDALGIALGGSRWGVWVLEVVSLAIAAGLAFRLFQRAFGTLPAVYASVAWMVNAFLVMDGGNYTTEYALPLQFGMLLVFATASEGPLTMRRAFVLGILSGLLFWLKQNDIGIPIAIIMLLVAEGITHTRRRESVNAIAGIGVGALVVSVLVILPFAVQGALAQFWDAAFRFNFFYIRETWLDRLLVLRYVPGFLPALGLMVFAALGWLVAAFTFANGLRDRQNLTQQWSAALDGLWGDRGGVSNALTNAQVVRLLALSLLILHIELVLVTISGNPFDHYFLALLPVLGILAAFAFRLVVAMLERAHLARWALGAFTALFVIVLMLFAVENVQPIWVRISQRKPPPVVDTILQRTTASDPVYVWGGGGALLFEARRSAPTRFVYSTPLLYRNYADEARAFELTQALLKEPPRLIVITPTITVPFLEFPVRSPRMDAAVAQLRAAYQQTTNIAGWMIYERRAP